MKKHAFSADIRTEMGRKAKALRRSGKIPANVYGKKTKSASISVDEKLFRRLYKEAGETGVVDLTITGDKETRPVLIRNIQYHPVSSKILHVDFHQIILTEKVEAEIPLEFTGVPGAVANKVGALMTQAESVSVKALPADLPDNFSIDVTPLAEVGQEIKVKDLKVDAGKIEILTDPEVVVVKITELVSKEAEELAKAEAEAAAAKAAEAGAAAPTEGGEAAPAEAPKEAPKAEEKKEEGK